MKAMQKSKAINQKFSKQTFTKEFCVKSNGGGSVKSKTFHINFASQKFAN
jgi:hypothetical protein